MKLNGIHQVMCILVFMLMVLSGGCDDGGSESTDLLSDMSEDTDATAQDLTEVSGCDATNPCSQANEVCDLSQGQCVERCTAESCPAGEICDEGTGLCAVDPGCSSNEDCEGDGLVCDRCTGACVGSEGKRICEEDINCFSDEYCDSCQGLCETRKAECEPCVYHQECGATGDLCLDMVQAGGRFCASSCGTLLDCPAGYLCEEIEAGQLQCVPASGDCSAPAACEGDEDCPDGATICREGRCVPGCEPGACTSGQVCDEGRCQAPCTERTEPCTEPSTCNPVSGLCEIEGSCRSSRDCDEPETYCDLNQLMCVPGCEVDDDCQDAYKECIEGSCEKRGCKGAWSCAFEQVCEMASKECMDAEGPYCDECDPDTEGSCGPEENKCVTLEDEEGNTQGDFCFVACSDDPDNECPQGYQCVPLQDQDGNPAGSVCARDCTTDPWE